MSAAPSTVATEAYKHATPSESLLRKRLANGKYCYEDDELHKQCSRCKDYWPADTEFFYAAKGGDGLNEWCKACYIAWRWPNGRKPSNEN
jgi:hypothetical protein